MKLHVRTRDPDLSCPYCMDSLRQGDTVAKCRSCGVRVHQACAQELTGCPTFGCSPPRVLAPPQPAPPLPRPRRFVLHRSVQVTGELVSPLDDVFRKAGWFLLMASVLAVLALGFAQVPNAAGEVVWWASELSAAWHILGITVLMGLILLAVRGRE